MSTKFVCDRCGKEIINFLPKKVDIRQGFLRTEYDLCNGCLNELNKFICRKTEDKEVE